MNRHSYRFSASVPSTYAAGIATLRVGWGGLKRDAFMAREIVHGDREQCECGLLKRRGAIACLRCMTLDDAPPGTKAMILRALGDFEARTTDEIARMIKRTRECVLRHVKPLIEAGRLRGWLEPQDISINQKMLSRDDEFGRRLGGRHASAPIRWWRRTW